jgi:hypothetical protein
MAALKSSVANKRLKTFHTRKPKLIYCIKYHKKLVDATVLYSASISFGQSWDDGFFSFQEWVHENYAGMKLEDFTAMQEIIAGRSSKPTKPTSHSKIELTINVQFIGKRGYHVVNLKLSCMVQPSSGEQINVKI